MSIENNLQGLSPLITEANNLVAKISNSRLWISSKDISALDEKIQEIANRIIQNQSLIQSDFDSIKLLNTNVSNLKTPIFKYQIALKNRGLLQNNIKTYEPPEKAEISTNTTKNSNTPTSASRSASTASLTETESLSSEEGSSRSTVTEEDSAIATAVIKNPDAVVTEEVIALIENKETDYAAKLLQTRPPANQISILKQISQDKPECLTIFSENIKENISKLIDEKDLKGAKEALDWAPISLEDKEAMLHKLIENGGTLFVVDLLKNTSQADIKNSFIKTIFNLSSQSLEQEVFLEELLPQHENIKFILEHAGTKNLDSNDLKQMLEDLDYNSLEFLTEHIEPNISNNIDSHHNQPTRSILQSLIHSLDSLEEFQPQADQKFILLSTLLTKSLMENPGSKFLEDEMNLWKNALEEYERQTDENLQELASTCLKLIHNLPLILEVKKENAPASTKSTETPSPSSREPSQTTESPSVTPSQSSETSQKPEPPSVTASKTTETPRTPPEEILSTFIGNQSVSDLFFTLIDPKNIESCITSGNKIVITMKKAEKTSVTKDRIKSIIDKQSTISRQMIKGALMVGAPILEVPRMIQIEKSQNPQNNEVTLGLNIPNSALLVGASGLKAVKYNPQNNKGNLIIAKHSDDAWIDNTETHLSINF